MGLISEHNLEYCALCGVHESARNTDCSVCMQLERARVVGVLDAWADKPHRVRSWELLKRDDGWDCLLHSGTGKTLYAGVQATPDAARAAAAKAIEAGEV